MTSVAKPRRLGPRRSARLPAAPQDVSNRDRILEAAENLLATVTFSGTHVDAVAAAAGVSKRLAYHYFGDKVGLYREVLRRVHRRWTAFEYFKDAPKDPLEFVDGFACWLFEKYRQDTNFVRLLMVENIIEGRHFEIASPSPSTRLLLTTFREVVQRGKLVGQLREDVDPVHLLANIMGLCFFTFSNTYTISPTLEMDFRSPAVLRERLDSIRHLVRRAISREPDGPSNGGARRREARPRGPRER